MRLRSSENSALCSLVRTTAFEALLALSKVLPSTQRASPADQQNTVEVQNSRQVGYAVGGGCQCHNQTKTFAAEKVSIVTSSTAGTE